MLAGVGFFLVLGRRVGEFEPVSEVGFKGFRSQFGVYRFRTFGFHVLRVLGFFQVRRLEVP